MPIQVEIESRLCDLERNDVLAHIYASVYLTRLCVCPTMRLYGTGQIVAQIRLFRKAQFLIGIEYLLPTDAGVNLSLDSLVIMRALTLRS